MLRQPDQKGQGLVELTIAASILASILGLVAFMASVGLRTITESGIREEATFIAQQGIETVKNFKDRNWGAQEVDSDGNGILDCPVHETCSDGISPRPGKYGQEPYINNGGGGDFISAAVCKVAAALCEGKFYTLGTLPLANPYCTEIRGDDATYLLRDTCEFDENNPPDHSRYTRTILIEDGFTHPNLLVPANVSTSCTNDSFTCNVRRITVMVRWGGTDAECLDGNNRECVRLVAYVAKWKEPPSS